MRRVAAVKIVTIAVTLATSLAAPAYSQGLSKRIGGSPYPDDNHFKIDEKAYKSALDRIPESGKKFDPWGGARPAEPARGKKSN